MGLLSYVVNFDEFIQGLQNDITINVGQLELDPTNIEDIFDKYFPDIISLLRQIHENTKPLEGTQKAKGFRKSILTTDYGHDFIFEVSSPVLLTGVSVSQSVFHQEDFWSLKIIKGDGAEITLFDSIYMKDTLNHKSFNVLFPVPSGYKVKIEYVNGSRTKKDFWADLEMVGVAEPTATKGTVIVNYLGKQRDGGILLLDQETHEGMTFGSHSFTASKTFTGYTLDGEGTKVAEIGTEKPTRLIEFMYSPGEIDIPHPYDFKGELTWNDSWVDLDLIAVLNQDLSKKVDFKKDYLITSPGNEIWLDLQDQGKEIFSIKGLEGNKIALYVMNYTGRQLSENPVFRLMNNGGQVIQEVVIPKSLLDMESDSRLVYLGDFFPDIGMTVKNISWDKL